MSWTTAIAICGFLTLALRHWCVPWLTMWIIAASIFASCKVLSWLNMDEPSQLSGARLLGYSLLWPGLRPQAFLRHSTSGEDSGSLWGTGFANVLAGLSLFALAFAGPWPWWVTAWLGMAGFSFLVHFGIFDLLAATWRLFGVPVEKLFVCPVAARSLADFWGRRWNRAFSGFAHDLLFRPTARSFGVGPATLVVFAFSGLVHELAISVPAGGGYGGPMLYFAIQGVLMVLEKSRFFRNGLRTSVFAGRLWTAAAVLIPLPLLFHVPFLRNVVLPFLHFLGE